MCGIYHIIDGELLEAEQELARRIEKKAKDLIGFKMAVQVVAPMTITRSEGKAKRLLDERDAA